MMECSLWISAGDHKNNNSNSNNNSLWGFSNESEHDLALMVSDFLENNGGSAGADSWCSSDSESGFSDLIHLADKISYYKHSVCHYDMDLLSVVHSLILSMGETDLHSVKSGPCNASCIRYSLVKLLRLSGYDAAVCVSRWQRSGKVPGAARSSLKQNSMPFPPWRSLAYLQAKWYSPYQRQFAPLEHDISGNSSSCHKQCKGHLRRLQPSLQSELEAERLLKPINIDNSRRLKHDRARRSSFRAL
ncbi:plant-specific domain family protein [Gossypium australe]|uniref:Plant-specific domain family protein n=1 Tax=Gossypium australe TaxID=47621 RepID=A0A5B6WLB9_9ROSI|nr:plant-specific domain family protein [Gossypium australe]